jgi:hypothetical protein
MGINIFFICFNSCWIGIVVGEVAATTGTFTVAQLAIILLNVASIAVQINASMKYKA